MILWNGDPLKWRGSPKSLLMPASPVQSCRKFSAVCMAGGSGDQATKIYYRTKNLARGLALLKKGKKTDVLEIHLMKWLKI